MEQQPASLKIVKLIHSITVAAAKNAYSKTHIQIANKYHCDLSPLNTKQILTELLSVLKGNSNQLLRHSKRIQTSKLKKNNGLHVCGNH